MEAIGGDAAMEEEEEQEADVVADGRGEGRGEESRRAANDAANCKLRSSNFPPPSFPPALPSLGNRLIWL